MESDDQPPRPWDPPDEIEPGLGEEQVEALARELFPVLREGTVCFVRRVGSSFDVGVYPTLRQDYPELYGFLLALNQRIASASGCLWSFFSLALAVLGVVGLHEFVPDLGGHAWWAYPLVVLAMFVVWGVGNAWAEAAVYRRHLDDLSRQLSRHGIGMYRLIEWLADDGQMQALLLRLKEEAGLHE